MFAYGPDTLYGSGFNQILLSRLLPSEAPQPRLDESIRFGLFPVRSPLLGKSSFLSFPAVT